MMMMVPLMEMGVIPVTQQVTVDHVISLGSALSRNKRMIINPKGAMVMNHEHTMMMNHEHTMMMNHEHTMMMNHEHIMIMKLGA